MINEEKLLEVFGNIDDEYICEECDINQKSDKIISWNKYFSKVKNIAEGSPKKFISIASISIVAIAVGIMISTSKLNNNFELILKSANKEDVALKSDNKKGSNSNDNGNVTENLNDTDDDKNTVLSKTNEDESTNDDNTQFADGLSDDGLSNDSSSNNDSSKIENPLTEVSSIKKMEKYLGFGVPILNKDVNQYFVIGEVDEEKQGRIIYEDGTEFDIARGEKNVSGIYDGELQKTENINEVKVLYYKADNTNYVTWSNNGYSYSFQNPDGEIDKTELTKLVQLTK